MLSSHALKLLAASGLVAVAVSACGRRGSLEPPQTSAPAAQTSTDSVNGRRTLPVSVGLGGVQAGDEVAIAAIPPGGTGAPVETSRGAKRGYRIPKEPFILDPLL